MYVDKKCMLLGRDIKGANILVDPNGEIKLADFGMAKHVSVLPEKLIFIHNYLRSWLIRKFEGIILVCVIPFLLNGKPLG